MASKGGGYSHRARQSAPKEAAAQDCPLRHRCRRRRHRPAQGPPPTSPLRVRRLSSTVPMNAATGPSPPGHIQTVFLPIPFDCFCVSSTFRRTGALPDLSARGMAQVLWGDFGDSLPARIPSPFLLFSTGRPTDRGGLSGSWAVNCRFDLPPMRGSATGSWGSARCGHKADSVRAAEPSVGILIHTPAWGATLLKIGSRKLAVFRSTRPRGGRHPISRELRRSRQFQSTSPAWERDRRDLRTDFLLI